MNRHVSTEQLSAYLDSELGFVEMRQLEAHCAACDECRARLASMRTVVAGLGRVERAVPPLALRQQIRRQVTEEVAASGLRGAFDSFRLLLFPSRPALHTAAAMCLALGVGLFAISHGPGIFPREPELQPGQEIVTVEPGAPFTLVPGTSQVAGREFIWTETSWVQRGLEGETPVARVDAGSPQGREMLTRYSGLGLLLAEGTPVVLRYKLETVEIRPPKIVGFDAHPRPHRQGGLVVS